MYFALAIVLGLIIGVVACLPNPRKRAAGFAISAVLGTLGAIVGWVVSIAMNAASIGPLAQIFFSIVAATALVALYQTVTSEPPALR